MTDREELLDQLYGFVLSGDLDQAVAAAREGLRCDIEPTALLFDAMIPALEEVGRRFETGEVFLPEMLIAANAMQGAMSVIRPLIVAAGVETIGRFVMGTVAGHTGIMPRQAADMAPGKGEPSRCMSQTLRSKSPCASRDSGRIRANSSSGCRTGAG